MFGRLLAVLLLIPFVDAVFLVYVSTRLGAVPTVLLVVVTALVGGLVVRAEGRHTVRRLQETVRENGLPTAELVDGALLIAAGAFLLTPGVVTDGLGFLFAFPLTRVPVRNVVLNRVIRPYVEKQTRAVVAENVSTFGGDVGDGSGERSSDEVDGLGDDAYDIEFEDDQ